MQRGPSFEYKSGSSTAGFIYCSDNHQKFFSLRGGIDEPSHLPQNCTICSSTKGLLLCHYPSTDSVGTSADSVGNRADPTLLHQYAVVNPYIGGAIRAITNPPTRHPNSIPRVLVVCRTVLDVKWYFFIVCILRDETGQAPRRFFIDIYSSKTSRWVRLNREIPERWYSEYGAGLIEEKSGVACARTAYWLVKGTAGPKSYLLFVDADEHRCRGILLPEDLNDSSNRQLGEHRGSLCLVGEARGDRIVYILDRDGKSWVKRFFSRIADSKPVRLNPKFLRQPPTLSRFQDVRLQVPLWFNTLFEQQKKLFIEDCTEGEKPPLTDEWNGPERRDDGGDILPLVRNSLLPVEHFEESP